MKLSFTSSALLLLVAAEHARGFVVPSGASLSRSRVIVHGYLDDLSKELYTVEKEADPEAESREATNMKKEDIDRFGPGTYKDFVDFDEFDGGDGQVGVVGDGNKSLEKFGHDVQRTLAKSKIMSAKNSWGRTTGYAEALIEKGMDIQRAQQLENWMNQQELLKMAKQQKKLTDEFDQVSDHEEDWRFLAKFGAERNQDFDYDKVFGEVKAGDTIEDTIEMRARIGQIVIQELFIRNQFLGFADFRAAFTADSDPSLSVTPSEGSMNAKEDTDFVIKFRPQNPGSVTGTLVIETEDFKMTWNIVGSTA